MINAQLSKSQLAKNVNQRLLLVQLEFLATPTTWVLSIYSSISTKGWPLPLKFIVGAAITSYSWGKGPYSIYSCFICYYAWFSKEDSNKC